METQKLNSNTVLNSFNNFKVMNKLGVSFFIMFLVGSFLPLVDLGGWSEETISLHTLASPTYLMILAVLGVLANISGISGSAARTISLIFITIIIGWLLSQLYDVYQTAREWSGSNDVDFRDFTNALKQMTQLLPSRFSDYVSFASILLTLSFVGIVCCIFSPRYKENMAFKAAITGQTDTAIDPSETPDNTEQQNGRVLPFIQTIKNTFSLLLKKAINLIIYVYQIIEPLVDSILEKGTDIICEKQAKLQRKPVKVSLLAVLILFLYFIIF